MIIVLTKGLKAALLKVLTSGEIDTDDPEIIQLIQRLEEQNNFNGFDTFMSECRDIAAADFGPDQEQKKPGNH